MSMFDKDSKVESDGDSPQGIQSDSRNPNKDLRPPRIPMGQGRNLDFSDVKLDKENYRYYAFLDHPDKPGRLNQAEAAYWEFVTDDAGRKITRPAGAGLHYLMKLPMKYAKEDLALKKDKIARRMATENAIGAGEYAPDPITGRPEGGRSAVTSETSDNPYS